MCGQFNNVPSTLGEAVIIDDCSDWQVFSKITLPAVRPGAAIVIILTFISAWGEFTYDRALTATTEAQALLISITFLRDKAVS